MQENEINPKVSVIIPTYNRAHLLERSMRSVLVQTFQDFELIVVDDGSSDNTSTVVKQFGDARVRYVRHNKNRGGAAARNTGINLAKGDFIAFQDSDDEWLSEKLEKQMSLLESCESHTGGVYCGFIKYNKSNTQYYPPANVQQKEGNLSLQILHGNFISTQTLLVRRECFKVVGCFDERLTRFQDWEMMIRLAQAFEFCIVDQPLLVVYSTSDSLTNNSYAGMEAYEIILEKHYRLLSRSPSVLADRLCNMGSLYCEHELVMKGRICFLKALKINPFSLTTWCLLTLSLLSNNKYRKIIGKLKALLRKNN